MSKIAFPRTMRNVDVTQLSRALDENMRYLERLLNATFDMAHDRLSNVSSDQHHVAYTDSDVDTIVATHTALPSAHHAKYLDADAVTAMGAKADSNPLNHDIAVAGQAGAGYRETVVFESDGTFTKADYSWLTHVRIRVQAGGGGGAGAGSNNDAGGGGGGGGYAEETVGVADLAAAETMTVGAGGAGGTAAADGTAGATSSFGTDAVATGGGGGLNAGEYFGGTGGIGTTGAVKAAGSDGGSGAVSATIANAGNGGSAILGGGGRGAAINAGTARNGNPGQVYGGGGGGGARVTNNANGGAGADGVIIVDLYDNSGGVTNQWTDYSPTYANLTVGNGSVTSRYIINAGLVTVRFLFVLGSTSAIGTKPAVSTPVTAHASGAAFSGPHLGPAVFYESGSVIRHGQAYLDDQDTIMAFAQDSSGTYLIAADPTATVPFTWGVGDVYSFLAVFEEA